MNLKVSQRFVYGLVASALFLLSCNFESETQEGARIAGSTSKSHDSSVTGENAIVGTRENFNFIAENRITKGNIAELLIDGPETYDAMFGAMEVANDHINLETFILADDDIGRRLAQVLARRVKEGVTVNLLYDAVGSGSTKESYFDTLRDGGVNLRAYQPLLETEPLDWHNRNHRKVLIVDGKIGFTGGLNFTDDYRFGSSSRVADDRFGDNWRDTHLKISGPAVTVLQKSFLKIWGFTGEGDPVALANYFPDINIVGNQDVVIVTASGDDDLGSRIVEQYKLAVNAAQSRVWITQAYFAPTDDVIECLKNAAHRGVDVRLLLPGETDVELAALAASAHYEDLISSGVRIYEFRGAILHAKTALIDNHWSTVGSSNFDVLSMEFNNELNAIVLDQKFTNQLAETFLTDLERAIEITPASWDNRSIWTKLKHGVAKIVQGGL